MHHTSLPYPGGLPPPSGPHHQHQPPSRPLEGQPPHIPGPYAHHQASAHHPSAQQSHPCYYRTAPPNPQHMQHLSSGPLPPVRTSFSDPPGDNMSQYKDINDLPKYEPPKPIEGCDGDRKYSLKVGQQPIRARMCGFGDKDRRPITPPPCVRLMVVDAKTGQEIGLNSVDHQHYVLTVDLWNFSGTKEVNLVKHSPNSPSISSAQQQSYRELEQNQIYGASPVGYQNAYNQGNYNGGYPGGSGPYGYPGPLASHNNRYPQDMSRLAVAPTASGMYTRNLIGSLAASAARLNDDQDKIGIWFVLQDLSVRTEGFFRLRFSYTALGIPNTSTTGQTSDNLKLNKGKARVLAQCFSDVFQVYSAKKFPGVCESTPLSKTFANQGIKIPIRKEGESGGRGRNKADEEEDGDEE